MMLWILAVGVGAVLGVAVGLAVLAYVAALFRNGDE
jgi:hypothetical protein